MKKIYQKPLFEEIKFKDDIVTTSYVKVISLDDAAGGIAVNDKGYIEVSDIDFYN